MARRLRIQFPGAIYHVTARGVERRRIFVDDVDRTRFLTQLGATARQCHVRLYLYCLMANHVHLVLETELLNLSQFMHKLETAYAVYFNLRHRRAGHLLQVVANVWGVEVGALRRRQCRCPARAVAARMLWAHAGLNQRQIGRPPPNGDRSVCERTPQASGDGDGNRSEASGEMRGHRRVSEC